MDKKFLDNLTNRKWLGEKMQKFRERHGKSIEDMNRSPYNLTGIRQNEDGAALPGWRVLVTFVAACGGELSEFVADLELDMAAPAIATKKLSTEEKKAKDRALRLIQNGDARLLVTAIRMVSALSSKASELDDGKDGKSKAG